MTGKMATAITRGVQRNGNRHDLLTDLLHCEWGFSGLVMTDWGSCDNGLGNPALCAPAGNDLVIPGSESDKQAILVALKSGRIMPDALRRSVVRVLNVIFSSAVYAEKVVASW